MKKPKIRILEHWSSLYHFVPIYCWFRFCWSV